MCVKMLLKWENVSPNEFCFAILKPHVNDVHRIWSGRNIRDNNKPLIQTGQVSLSGIKIQSCLIQKCSIRPSFKHDKVYVFPELFLNEEGNLNSFKLLPVVSPASMNFRV